MRLPYSGSRVSRCGTGDSIFRFVIVWEASLCGSGIQMRTFFEPAGTPATLEVYSKWNERDGVDTAGSGTGAGDCIEVGPAEQPTPRKMSAAAACFKGMSPFEVGG